MGVSSGTGRTRPILEPGVGQKPRHRLVRLSKIEDYLADNLLCIRLSDLRHTVNDKKTREMMRRERAPSLEKRQTWDTPHCVSTDACGWVGFLLPDTADRALGV